MSADFRKLLLKAGTWAILALGLITFVLFAVSIGGLVERLVDHFLGRKYEFQSIGEYLHVRDPHYKVLSWDHWFLGLAAAAAVGKLTGWVGSSLEWLEKSPEERQDDRNRRRQEQKRATEALAEKQRIERETKADRKAARKPMSGWRRLWIRTYGPLDLSGIPTTADCN